MKNKIYRFAVIIGIFSLVVSCKNPKEKINGQVQSEQDTLAITNEGLYRPNFHFTSATGWMNDPNGMFFYNGYYHLYFQHYPDGTTWGPMHWGHAISTDLFNWKEQPIALYPDDLGYIFSGSAVVDHENTSGFGADGKTPIVAIFTSHDPKKEKTGEIDVENQSIAYSLDEGLTWTKYKDNPVLKNPGARDFRDPKVSWDEQKKRWTMVLAAGQEIQFYTSKDLKSWEKLTSFGEGIGNHDGVWECPDFFQLPVIGSSEKKWVLLVSINPGGPNTGSATQYFVGDFDGSNFILDESFKQEMGKEHTFWVDYGRDNYAGVTFSNIENKDGGKLFMGWMSNWLYANEVPTEKWRSAMTIARTLELTKGENTFRLVANPVPELNEFASEKLKNSDVLLEGNTLLTTSKAIDFTRAQINFKVEDLVDGVYTFELSNSEGDSLRFGYDTRKGNYFVDRNKAGITDFSNKFSDRIAVAPRIASQNDWTGTIVIDKTSIELFFDDGQTVMTEIFFPKAPFDSLYFEAPSEESKLEYIEIHQLKFNLN
ncbi:glycoside hydrolase family 32 protein [Maribacter hydrothermalis]|uniref:Glycosyl hydrolase family 32 n=1 Tax=Maribacter hydrothermalis TaxID=1836467 RepID=A0A1B7ZFA6_9FLAO|nr:glycoside hydrolase family 32 protein [Maribacter hydrothermalis]APQ17771.1 glycosyl hydrolase family 32 [Maribacter hydrothermalis]OBR42245.1 glycosyl hydrolase family 32 [Maribacter hydrothermalis]